MPNSVHSSQAASGVEMRRRCPKPSKDIALLGSSLDGLELTLGRQQALVGMDGVFRVNGRIVVPEGDVAGVLEQDHSRGCSTHRNQVLVLAQLRWAWFPDMETWVSS